MIRLHGYSSHLESLLPTHPEEDLLTLHPALAMVLLPRSPRTPPFLCHFNNFVPLQSPTGPYYPSSFYYQGFEDDIFLLIKLSHVALIVFIIFAIVTMIYLVVSCCVSFTRRREKDVSGAAPFTELSLNTSLKKKNLGVLDSIHSHP